MKLLMTADAVGGVWTYALDLAAALAPHGVETVIAVLGPSPSPRQRQAAADIAADMAGVTLVDTGLALDWLAPDAERVHAAADAIRTLARDVAADLVHLNSPVLAAGDPYRLPVVAAVHGCVATWWDAAHGGALPAGFAWHEAMMRDGLAAADAVVAPSHSYAATVAQRYALARVPHAIHNGRTPLPPGEATPAAWAFTAGRLWDRVKNTALLDRVAARVPIRAAGPVGAPHGETVTTRHLQLLGTLDDRGLAQELAGRPVFVSAARFEPFGLAVLEAAQAGCPLVLADIDTFRELWSDAVIFARDEADYVAAIEGLLADPAAHARWGDRARTRAARYTPAATAAAMAALYAQLLPAERVAA